MTAAPRRRLVGDILALAAPLAIGGAGGAITLDRIPTWYGSLAKPSWNPPDAVFGPVWTSLYILMGVAMVLVRRSSEASPRDVRVAEAVNGLQLALNFGWTLAFFGARDTRNGVIAILLLWASIVATIATFGRVRRAAAFLLLPYLAWVTFATLLNVEVWRLNER